MRISQFLPIAIRAVIDYKRGGSTWVSPLLQGLEANGRITLMSLAPIVKVVDPNSGERKLYSIKQLSIPIIWSQADEDQATENQKISLSKELAENAIDSHDDLLLREIGSGRAVVSTEYHYNIGEVIDILPATPNDYISYICHLYTAAAFIPQ